MSIIKKEVYEDLIDDDMEFFSIPWDAHITDEERDCINNLEVGKHISNVKDQGVTETTLIDPDAVEIDEKPETVWHVALPSHKEYLNNKDVNYKVLGALLLYGKPDFSAKGDRYIYYHELQDISKKFNISMNVLKQNINKMRNVSIDGHDPLITVENKSKGLIYRIKASIKNEATGSHGYFIKIPSDILKKLVMNCRSSTIRVYMVIRLCCRKYPHGRELHRDYVANLSGLKTSSTISKITSELASLGVIKKKTRGDMYDKGDGKLVPITIVKYWDLVPFENKLTEEG